MNTCVTNTEKLESKNKLRDLYNLTKPTITFLVVVTVLPAMLLSSETLPSGLLVLYTLLGTGLMSASAAVFNQILEENVDQTMERTRSRSLPSGKVSTSFAFMFGTILGLLGACLLYLKTTPLALWVSLFGHLFYTVIYTLILKRKTPQNIVIGGIAGAVGPLIGSAAVSGSLNWMSWTLFLIITLWTPPHFWALALKYKKDYEKAGIPMYPNIYGDESTRKAMMYYSISLIPFVLSFFIFQKAGWFYFIIASFCALKFAYDSFEIYRSHSNEKVMRFFYFSCTYTFVIFLALTIDRLLILQ